MTREKVLENNAMIVAILLEMIDPKDIPVKVSLEGLTVRDKITLLTTCCALVIETSICTLAHNKENALEGLRILVASMQKNIEETRVYDEPIRH